jgi:hypothetical protein
MRPIVEFSSCAARLRIDDALAALLVASPESGPSAPKIRGGLPDAPYTAAVTEGLAARLRRYRIGIATTAIATMSSEAS